MNSIANDPNRNLNPYQQYIHKSRYSKWLDDKGRREDFTETVDRYVDFMYNSLEERFSDRNLDKLKEMRPKIREHILNQGVMPSMRAVMSAGPALSRDNTCGYNCSYLPVDSIESFDEAMFILMCGTGVGFSVERQYINKLPIVPENLTEGGDPIVVEDSKEGWATALRIFLMRAFNEGIVSELDTSKVREKGARLKTFGGRASGPQPFKDLIAFCTKILKASKGRKLNSIECHDIMCKIGDIVVVGGVRRSAMISLSNLSDQRMRDAKNGMWYSDNPQRALSNNSVSYTENPDVGSFMSEWFALYMSKSGERGIFNRVAAKNQAGKTGRRDTSHEFGTNPCSEIILRPYQFCNLTEVVARHGDTEGDLMEKVAIASVLGTIQATLTEFPYLRSIWKTNTEEENLLGVSLTGIMDHPLLSKTSPETAALLEKLKTFAIEVNKQVSDDLGVNQSTAITCVN